MRSPASRGWSWVQFRTPLIPRKARLHTTHSSLLDLLTTWLSRPLLSTPLLPTTYSLPHYFPRFCSPDFFQLLLSPLLPITSLSTSTSCYSSPAISSTLLSSLLLSPRTFYMVKSEGSYLPPKLCQQRVGEHILRSRAPHQSRWHHLISYV